jgi:hypothetical protein
LLLPGIILQMKEIISGIAVFLTFAAYVPYYRDIIQGKTHPHIYSWSLWSLLTILLVALQLTGGAGAASWVTIAAGMLCVGVVILSLKDGKKDITTSDTIVAILSLIAIGFWWFANQPVVSIILVIIADALAFIPTVRKSWHKPYDETLSLYATNAFRFFLALAAVETYTFLSTSWIIFWATGNALFALMLVVRRKQVKPEAT